MEKSSILGNFSQNLKEEIEKIGEDSNGVKSSLRDNEDGVNVPNQESEVKDVRPKNKKRALRASVVKLNYLNAARVKAGLKAEHKKNENEIQMLRAQVEELMKLTKVTEPVPADDIQEENPNLDANEKEMLLISYISIFLFYHQEGVNLNGIHSYIKDRIPIASAGELENFLRRHPNVFEESLPIGASQEKRWICISMDQRT